MIDLGLVRRGRASSAWVAPLMISGLTARCNHGEPSGRVSCTNQGRRERGSLMVGIQAIKNYLVALGPDHPLVRVALSARARVKNFRLSFDRDVIRISKGGRVMLLARCEYTLVPFMIDSFGSYFDTIEPKRVGDE